MASVTSKQMATPEQAVKEDQRLDHATNLEASLS